MAAYYQLPDSNNNMDIPIGETTFIKIFAGEKLDGWCHDNNNIYEYYAKTDKGYRYFVVGKVVDGDFFLFCADANDYGEDYDLSEDQKLVSEKEIVESLKKIKERNEREDLEGEITSLTRYVKLY